MLMPFRDDTAGQVARPPPALTARRQGCPVALRRPFVLLFPDRREYANNESWLIVIVAVVRSPGSITFLELTNYYPATITEA